MRVQCSLPIPRTGQHWVLKLGPVPDPVKSVLGLDSAGPDSAGPEPGTWIFCSALVERHKETLYADGDEEKDLGYHHDYESVMLVRR